jgi:NTP pyrophosphatase (non-canonical NTP hydrolase)
MDLSEIQRITAVFERERGWDKFNPSLVFTHLIEELGEISRHITVEEGYKVIGLGHDAPSRDELSREFAQVLALLLQLANFFEVDLEKSILSELEIMKNRFPADKWSEHMKDF